MKNYHRYFRQYYLPKKYTMNWTKKEYIEKPPIWCSVDLRDGNQALVTPMNIEEKIRFFKLLVKLGFKEIEIGFPAASDTEFFFLRTLIEHDLIPDDIRIQVLTQARPHIIERTFEAMEGLDKGILHLYNSVSYAQRTQVFRKSKEAIKKIALENTKLIMDYIMASDKDYMFEYSPESFSATEPEYALDVCNSVIDLVRPKKDKKMIINLPTTVELALPHIYATQVEYISDHLIDRDKVILSLHTHNDRGCGVADTELALLAGAERVEGSLFGNGERTGNVDLVTLALNLYMHGVDPKLDFSDIPSVIEVYEECTKMQVYERTPYGGALVFAAFSGSHQDAIAKAMDWHKKHSKSSWSVPYLTIDPNDINRSYETDVIRINSQSGKSGVGFVLEQIFGLRLPKEMAVVLGKMVKEESDKRGVEMTAADIFEIFKRRFESRKEPYNVVDVHYLKKNGIEAIVESEYNGTVSTTIAKGNGRLNAVSNALKKCYGFEYNLHVYEEHALERSSSSRVIAYVGIQRRRDKEIFFGAGLDTDLVAASVDALVTAINVMSKN